MHHQLDTLGRELEIRYFRDVDGREVDFVVVERRRPILFVEAKLSATGIAPSLRYLHERFPDCPAYQVHLRGPADAQISDGIHPSLARLALARHAGVGRRFLLRDQSR